MHLDYCGCFGWCWWAVFASLFCGRGETGDDLMITDIGYFIASNYDEFHRLVDPISPSAEPIFILFDEIIRWKFLKRSFRGFFIKCVDKRGEEDLKFTGLVILFSPSSGHIRNKRLDCHEWTENTSSTHSEVTKKKKTATKRLNLSPWANSLFCFEAPLWDVPLWVQIFFEPAASWGEAILSRPPPPFTSPPLSVGCLDGRKQLKEI